MTVPPMIGAAHFDARRVSITPAEIASAPNAPAVFLVHAAAGQPYLARTALLQRRLARLFRETGRTSRLLNLSGVAEGIDYWLSGSRLESGILFYSLARLHYPDNYDKFAKLRMPAYLRLTLGNAFPRTQVTTRPVAGRSFYFGPFRTKAGAEQFESQSLDLFQLRRCQENLEPNPEHPGCIYGEMSMCLRPCQQVVNVSEYASEVERYRHFLCSGGQSLLDSIAAARDRWSEEMEFEEAARQHKRHERVQQVLALKDELSGDLQRLSGVAVTPSASPDAVTLWFLLDGAWCDPVEFPLARAAGASMDHRIRDVTAALAPLPRPFSERLEHIALLQAWHSSSWRDGDFLAFTDIAHVPVRKLVNAIARISKKTLQTSPQ